MPTYEYRCPDGHEFERFYRTISGAQGEVSCPTCGLVAERRMSAGAGLLFKGSGFYITDYGKDGKKDRQPAAKAEGSAAPAVEGAAAGAAGGEGAKPSGEGGKAASEPKPAAAPPPAAPPKPSGSAE
jgi:putative FmdB family regulatory protein